MSTYNCFPSHRKMSNGHYSTPFKTFRSFTQTAMCSLHCCTIQFNRKKNMNGTNMGRLELEEAIQFLLLNGAGVKISPLMSIRKIRAIYSWAEINGKQSNGPFGINLLAINWTFIMRRNCLRCKKSVDCCLIYEFAIIFHLSVWIEINDDGGGGGSAVGQHWKYEPQIIRFHCGYSLIFHSESRLNGAPWETNALQIAEKNVWLTFWFEYI